MDAPHLDAAEGISGQQSNELTTADLGDAEAEVTLHEDNVVADKKTVPVERVGLEVNEVTHKQSVSDAVRKERIETEGIDAAGGRTPESTCRPNDSTIIDRGRYSHGIHRQAQELPRQPR